MAQVSTYLNFKNNTEEVFNFYKSVFNTEFLGEISRFGSIPPHEGMPPIPDSIKNAVMHVALPITGGHLLMGTDAPEEMGFKLVHGNNIHIAIHTDTKEEADQLYAKLSAGGTADMPMADMFWGDYYGSLTDKYGIKWMLNFASSKKM